MKPKSKRNSSNKAVRRHLVKDGIEKMPFCGDLVCFYNPYHLGGENYMLGVIERVNVTPKRQTREGPNLDFAATSEKLLAKILNNPDAKRRVWDLNRIHPSLHNVSCYVYVADHLELFAWDGHNSGTFEVERLRGDQREVLTSSYFRARIKSAMEFAEAISARWIHPLSQE